MRRIGPSLIGERAEITLDGFLSSTLSGTIWTEQVEASLTEDDVWISNNYGTLNPDVYETYDTLDGQTRVMMAAFHEVAQRLSQATIASIHLTSLSPFIQRHLQEQDIWVEMPPLSVRDVVMDVQRMGWGEPLPFPEEFTEE